jgi:hypothetical protein
MVKNSHWICGTDSSDPFISTPTDVDQSISSQNTFAFHKFSHLPTELRLDIWSQAFLPHRKTIDRLTIAKRIQPSTYLLNLQLTCREATAVFLTNYTRIMDIDERRCSYFNYSLDLICFYNVSTTLRYWSNKKYPSFMARLECIEFAATILDCFPMPLEALLAEMPSLRFIIIKVPLIPEVRLHKEWSLVWIKQLRQLLSVMDSTSKPVLAVLCPRVLDDDLKRYWQSVEIRETNDTEPFQFNLDFNHCFKAPSDLILNRFDVGISDQWKGSWPGKHKLFERRWIAYEVV